MFKHLKPYFMTVLNPITTIDVPLEIWEKLPKQVYKGYDAEINLKDTHLANSLKKIQRQRLKRDYQSWMYVVELDGYLYIRMEQMDTKVSVIVFEIAEFESVDEYMQSSQYEMEIYDTLEYPILNVNSQTTDYYLNLLKEFLNEYEEDSEDRSNY